jgi:hypothetical protein
VVHSRQCVGWDLYSAIGLYPSAKDAATGKDNRCGPSKSTTATSRSHSNGAVSVLSHCMMQKQFRHLRGCGIDHYQKSYSYDPLRLPHCLAWQVHQIRRRRSGGTSQPANQTGLAFLCTRTGALESGRRYLLLYRSVLESCGYLQLPGIVSFQKRVTLETSLVKLLYGGRNWVTGKPLAKTPR